MKVDFFWALQKLNMKWIPERVDLWLYSVSLLLAITNFILNLLSFRIIFILACIVLFFFFFKEVHYTLCRKCRIKGSTLCLEVMSTGVLLDSKEYRRIHTLLILLRRSSSKWEAQTSETVLMFWKASLTV